MDDRWKLSLIFAFLGKGWNSLLLFVATPLYLSLLGVEAYGLVGFFQSLIILSNLFELGLGTTLNREMASLSISEKTRAERQDLVRTLEILYWVLASLVGLTALLIAPVMANSWFNTQLINVHQLHQSLMYMGLAIALQMPMYIYSSGLMGLHRQVSLNTINILASTFRVVTTLIVLKFFSSSIIIFFVIQALASLIHTLLLRETLWLFVRMKGLRKRFSFPILKRIWKYSLGVTGIYITSLILTQTDKVIISRTLSLETLGYYSIAAILAQGLYTFINPVFSVFFPKFSQLVAENKLPSLIHLYHKSCKILAVVLFPIAGTMSVFSADFLALWTGNLAVVLNAKGVLSFLILGTLLNGAINLPYGLQLAYGWVKFSLYQNLIALLFFPFILVLLISHFGAVGAASTWFFVNLAFSFIAIPLMHKKLLPSERISWLLGDLLIPLLVALGVPYFCSLVLSDSVGVMDRIAKIGGVYTLTTVLTFSVIRIKLLKQTLLSTQT